MKVAIVHEWLVSYAGAELVLTQIIDCFPEADLFSVIDFLPKNQRHLIRDKKVNTTFIFRLSTVEHSKAGEEYTNYKSR